MPVAVVIPCYRARATIRAVVAGVIGRVAQVYVVDDACPEESAATLAGRFSPARLTVLRHAQNQGVGGATITGYRQALADGHAVVVKMDADGQMDPAELPALVGPILAGEADYTKGNRFFDLGLLGGMPRTRLFGNACLSFVNKLSSGYWEAMDPTNGYTAIHRAALARLPLDRLARRYFFESDMLFRLGTIRAVVRDVPMAARYGGEVSSLRIGRVLADFPRRYLACLLKRFFYLYLLRDCNVGSLNTLLGLPMLGFGVGFGALHWWRSVASGIPAATGTVMLAVLPIILGVQLLLQAAAFDVANRCTAPLQRLLGPHRPAAPASAPRRTALAPLDAG
ncbi:MAG: glycosyltransferase family 2 protein [Rhodospirillales bacterium]|nr:glycosyltransferase family 2 protein [Rhodospirillales bacterium]